MSARPDPLLANQPIGTALIGTGEHDGTRVLRTNSRMAELLASAPQDLVGTDACDHIHPEDRSAAFSWFAALVLDASRSHEGALRLLTRDGAVLEATLFASTVAYAGGTALLVRIGPARL